MDSLTKKYDKLEQDITITVQSLLPTLTEKLFEQWNVEELIQQLHQLKGNDQSKKVNGQHKMAIWQDIKLKSFTRTVSCIYLLNLLYNLYCLRNNRISRGLKSKRQAL